MEGVELYSRAPTYEGNQASTHTGYLKVFRICPRHLLLPELGSQLVSCVVSVVRCVMHNLPILRAPTDTPTRTLTFAGLPREWWGDAWFHDGADRLKPEYARPHCMPLASIT